MCVTSASNEPVIFSPTFPTLVSVIVPILLEYTLEYIWFSVLLDGVERYIAGAVNINKALTKIYQKFDKYAK